MNGDARADDRSVAPDAAIDPPVAPAVDARRAAAAAGTLPDAIAAVVVGASAGGVEALMALLPRLPATFAPAVLVVLHLPRERSSVLPDLLAARCALPVCEAEDKMPIEGGTIYFAPADYHLLVEQGPSLALSVDDPVNYSRPSIDVMFETAADVYGPALAAIVLTGANHDGAAGLVAVVRDGGFAIVEDPRTARMPAMPSAALERVDAHVVLPVDGIAALLARSTSRTP